MKKTTAEQEISLGYHIICLVVNFLAVKHSLVPMYQWFTFQRYGGQWKYLSHLLMYANLTYSAYAILADIYCIIFDYNCKPTDEDDEEDNRPMVVKIRDELFNSLSFPFSLCHSAAFIAATSINSGFFVSMINRRKETLTAYYMVYLHLFPLVNCLLESSLVYHKYSKDKKAFVKTGIAAVLYLIWILWVAFYGQYWSYPLFRRANILVRSLLLLIFPVLTTGCYFVGQKITEKMWLSDSDMEKIKSE